MPHSILSLWASDFWRLACEMEVCIRWCSQARLQSRKWLLSHSATVNPLQLCHANCFRVLRGRMERRSSIPFLHLTTIVDFLLITVNKICNVSAQYTSEYHFLFLYVGSIRHLSCHSHFTQLQTLKNKKQKTKWNYLPCRLQQPTGPLSLITEWQQRNR